LLLNGYVFEFDFQDSILGLAFWLVFLFGRAIVVSSTHGGAGVSHRALFALENGTVPFNLALILLFFVFSFGLGKP
jgi:hypothetical protein